MEMEDLHRLIVVDQSDSAMSRELQVVLDGIEIGTVSKESIVTCNMIAGRHRLELRDGRSQAALRDIFVQENQHLTRAFVRVTYAGRAAITLDEGGNASTPPADGDELGIQAFVPLPETRQARRAPAAEQPAPVGAGRRRGNGSGSFFLRHVLPVVLAFALGVGASAAYYGEKSERGATQRMDAQEESPQEGWSFGDRSFLLYRSSLGTLWGQALVEVRNNGGVPLTLVSAAYDLEDAEGGVVASKSMVSTFPDVLMPGETGYIYDDAIYSGLDPDAAYTVIPHLSVRPSETAAVRYDVSEFRLEERETGGLTAIGRVTNNTGVSGSGSLYAAVVLYDANRRPLTLMYSTLVDELSPGDTMGFEVSGFTLPEGVDPGSVAGSAVFAYPVGQSA